MTINWTLLLDADMTNVDWSFSVVTDATVLRIDQENPPSLGRFAVSQVSSDLGEFFDIKPYPARAESTRINLDYPGTRDKRIGIKPRYSEFPEGTPNTWRIKIYGAKTEFNPPVNPSAVLITLDPRIAGAVPVEEKGVPFGVATLNENGLVPDSQLPFSEWTELLGANLAATDALAIQVENIVIPPAPTLESLGAEAAGAELRARQYTDEEIAAIAFPPTPTLESLGAEAAGAESRSRLYTTQQVAALLERIRILERRHATRINCGNGPQYYGSEGLWQADIYFPSMGTAVVNVSASFPSNPPATGYSDPLVLNTMRFAATFEYSIPIANGSHTVDLLFCEPYFSNPGEKIFNVFLQGQQLLSNFDILATAKKMETVVRTFNNIVVSNNRLVVRFTSVKDQASISGIIIRHGS